MNTPATRSDIPSTYYKMPPVGLTVTRASIGEKVILSYTLRCGSINCWFVGHAATEPDAQLLINEHQCPTPPARNELPTGRSTLEKMWDELDDVTKAIIEKSEYNGMQGASLKAYALGCAFALSMMTHPYFRTVKEISRQLGKRYKMSKGEIPWEPTPSYNYNPLPESLTANVVLNKPMAKTTTSEKKPSVSRVKRAIIPADKQAVIMAGLASNMFSHEDIAAMYQVPIESVRALAASMG